MIAMARKPEPRCRPVWLVTFTDLIALLLTFFVMIFATHKVERQPWEALSESLNRALNPSRNVVIERPRADRNARPLSPEYAFDLGYLESILQLRIDTEPDLAGVALQRFEDRLVVVLPAELLFGPGSAAPTPASRKVLLALGTVLGHIGNRLTVHGHTDPMPLRESRLRSNWELSIARAAAIANELRRAGYRREIDALGFSDTRFADLSEVGDTSRRMAFARRVDVIIHPIKGLSQ
jgi:chemotaxis protein MotB